jgi:hypothetical protein
VALPDAVEGDEGDDAIRSLIDSIQAEHDYGAYQATIQAIMCFLPKHFTQGLVEALPGLIYLQPDWAGELLSLVADGELHNAPQIDSFNRHLSECRSSSDGLDKSEQSHRPHTFGKKAKSLGNDYGLESWRRFDSYRPISDNLYQIKS